MRPRFVGIGGGTGAGKTTLVDWVRQRFHRVCALDLDSYYRDRGAVDLDARDRLNYDEPAAIDVDLLIAHVRRLGAGEPVAKPRYFFESHTRVGVDDVYPAPIVLVDGLFTLWWAELRARLDLKVFVDAPPDLRLARRIRRDVAERGRTVESVLAQYLDTVRPMHERYVEPTRGLADIVVTSAGPVEAWSAPVTAALEAFAARTRVEAGRA